jgi:hypothetical protein
MWGGCWGFNGSSYLKHNRSLPPRVFNGNIVHCIQFLAFTNGPLTKQRIIERTLKVLRQLPTEKAEEISDCADFVAKRYKEQLLSQGIQKLMADSVTFDFWDIEEDLYTESKI